MNASRWMGAAVGLLMAAGTTEARAQGSTMADPPAPDSLVATGPRAYRTMTFALAGTRASDDGALARYWRSGPGMRAELRTPFHIGTAAAFVITLPYAARSDSQPDYRGYLVGIEWRLAPRAMGIVQPHVGIGAGGYVMRFDGVSTKGLASESEIFVDASTGIAVRLFRSTAVTGTLMALHAFTSTPIRSVFASVGVEHTVLTPTWLRRVIE